MKNISLNILLILLICPISLWATNQFDPSTKKERNYIRQGNEQYADNHYRDAEVLYKKALEINPTSEIAQYNLASTLMKQSGSAQANSPNNPIMQADSIFRNLAHNAIDKKVAENSYYNLGNISFDKQDYAQSIEMYKSALRINPENDDARENLRLAQLKKQEQDQNKNKNNDKNKDNEQKKDKNKEQNKDNQNQNKQDNEKQNKDKDKQNQDQNQQQNQQQQKQDKQQSQGISDANAEKILKTMENEENATRRKVNELRKKEDEKNASRRRITNQW
ncbi:MAG: tetratricopeptide repeat protein [Muribaculaceae bacterium]|nr:tetratricopeptide repeat protein [Muribaculaceae bacterium]